MNDLIYAPEVGQKIVSEFGAETLEHVKKVGFQFTAGIKGKYTHMT